MKNAIIVFAPVWFLFLTCVYAQDVIEGSNLPKVSTLFTTEIFKDDFDADNGNWPIITNADNLFIIQDGKYILHRKNISSLYYLLTKKQNTLESFHIKTAIKLDPANSNNQSSAGIIFMANDKGKGAFVIELNTQKQYRIKQLIYNNYHFLSGEEKNSGWVKLNGIFNKDDFNIIEVKTFQKQYDIFINQTYITSFTEITYKYGGMGFVVSQDTKAEVDYFYVYSDDFIQTASDTVQNTTTNTEAQMPVSSSSNPKVAESPTIQNNDIISLSEAIVNLKLQINELKSENHKLKGQVSGSKDLLKTVKSLENNLLRLQLMNDSLMKDNKLYVKYKEMINKSDNKDLVIILSKSLKNESIKNEALIKEFEKLKRDMKLLQDSLNIFNEKFYHIQGNLTPQNKVSTLDSVFTSPSDEISVTDNKKPIESEEDSPGDDIFNSKPQKVKVQQAIKREE